MPDHLISDAQAKAFIAANTQLLCPPLVPELQLHLALESLPIWQRTEEELGEMNVPPPFWAFAWAGGQALARYILDTPESVTGKKVLDIGSGSGIVALAARLAGAASVMANDIDPFANTACALNADANRLTISISRANMIDPFDDEDADAAYLNSIGPSDLQTAKMLQPVEAGTGAHAAIDDRTCYDVICLGDTFYEEAMAIDALMFAENAHAAGARILVGDPSRSYFPRERFRLIREYSVPVTRELEDSEIKKTAVWTFDG